MISNGHLEEIIIEICKNLHSAKESEIKFLITKHTAELEIALKILNSRTITKEYEKNKENFIEKIAKSNLSKAILDNNRC